MTSSILWAAGQSAGIWPFRQPEGLSWLPDQVEASHSKPGETSWWWHPSSAKILHCETCRFSYTI